MYTVRRNKNKRLTIKGFKSSDAMHKFLNSQSDNSWIVNSEPDYYGCLSKELSPLKPGTYAYAGGKWHNVKSLDSCVLAHI